jgi:hypothetical protein
MSILLGNPFFLNAAAAGGYQISRSLRFNSADSAYLSRTPASAGNRKTWTWAGWVKRSDLTSQQTAWSAGSTGTNRSNVLFQGNGEIRFFNYAGSVDVDFVTTPVYRDASAWYHLVISVDTTQATSTNRFSLYVNGVQVTVFSTATYPSLNQDLVINSAIAHGIGRGEQSGGEYFSGYLADIYFIDGQALTPSSFGQLDANNEWQPKTYSGTFGTNGFWLKFADNSSNTATTLGADSSGNGNNWTPNNLQTSTGGQTSVAAATGALPILNTTDTYGTTLGSGVASDAYASSLQLDLPLGTSAGLNITDQSPTGRTSAIKTITNSSVINETSISKYYSGSANFASSSSATLIAAGTGLTFPVNTTDSATIEFWIYMKSSTLANRQFVVGKSNWGNSTTSYNDGISIEQTNSTWSFSMGTAGVNVTVTQANGAWAHFAAVRNGSSLLVFVNGVRVASATAGSSVSPIAGDMVIGNQGTSGGSGGLYAAYLNGYLSDFRYYVGIAKYTGSFNPPSATQNTTVAPGNDSLVDTPTSYGTDTGAGGEVRGNYCLNSPLDNGGVTLTNGNLDVSFGTAARSARATFGMSSGKWYWEATTTNTISNHVGIAKSGMNLTNYPGADANGWSHGLNGYKYNNGSATLYGSSFSVGDVIGTAFDADAGTLTFYKNGVSEGTAFTSLTSGPYFPVVGTNGTGGALSFNFGQRPFAYTAPSGFKALCDTNLPAPTIAQGSTVMDVKLYTGNGSTQTISGLGFSPDFVWIKSRNDTYSHRLLDTVRGATNVLYSNGTDAEATDASSLTAFNSDGFTLGSTAGVNGSSTTFASWAWDAGSTTVTNTQGSITSSVRANPSAGFSIVTYTGNATAGATVGHGLGVAPQFIIVKNRATSPTNWSIYHVSIGATKRLTFTTAAEVTISSIWNNTTPGSSVFTLGDSSGVNETGISHVAYCFAPVAGLSSYGTYQGNGSADGPFIYLGFRPAVVLVKMSSSTGNWTILDDKREGYNVDNDPLYPNLSDAEGTTDLIDITSNGFKVRTTDANFNTNAGTYIYAAWASSPFAYSRAR